MAAASVDQDAGRPAARRPAVATAPAEYLTHFAAPIVAGLWLWRWHRRHVGDYVSAYVLMMASGFLVHLLYTQTPPWLAARSGVLPHVDRIVVLVLDQIHGFGHLYAGADPEPNGAMPALHVALPVLIVCFVIGNRGVRLAGSWLWVLYPLSITFAALYLGEHYLLDVVAGTVLGLLCFAGMRAGRRLLSRLIPRLAEERALAA